MKFFINSILILLLSCSVFAQNWSVHFSPRFRVLNDVHIHNPEEIVIIGGRPFNDSITYMAYSSTAGQTWDIFTDIFPGKMINTAIFKNNITGYCAGQNEAFYKTIDGGKTWSPFNIGINLNHKNINKLFKSEYNVFFATGGLNNENGFLLKSSDGGNTWSSIYNWASNEIITAASPKTNTIIVGGLNGFLQISTDGAESWQNCNYPNLEILPEITGINFFDNNNGFCCGGVRGQDSTAIILKTTDGGSNWTISLNTTAPRLNDICMASEQVIYAVGDYGTVLKSEDGGTSWNEENIDGNPGVDLFAVNFLNTHLGAISGRYGYVMIFDDGQTNLPEVSTLEATKVTTSSAILNAVINPGFSDSEVSFLYGTNDNTEHEINCGTFSGGELKSIEKSISNLETDTKYYFRAKLNNSYGEYYGNIKYFYTGNPIPNWDFEIWDNITKDFPNNWGISGGFEKIQYSDFTAIRLFTDSSEDKSSSLINGEIEGENMAPWHIPVESIIGGLQINERPDSIYINLKYNIDDNDTAVFFVGLIKDNFYVAENYFFIIGNQPDFHLNRYKINYLTSDIPDKAIIVLTNSNPFMDTVTNSVVEVSEIYFSNHSPEIPNYNFTDWHTSTFYQPFSWQNIIGNHQFDNFGNPDNFCEPSLDAYHNQYSIKLINNVNTNNHPIPGRISLTNWNDGIPINKRFYNFNGAYKFFKAAQDTATIHLILYSDDIQVGFTVIKITETIDEWTFFSVPISYNDPFVIPNKMNVIISASQWPPTGNSILYVDKLTLDGDFIPVNEFNIVNNTVFPIPAIDMLYFNFTAENVQIFNIFGKIVKSFIGTCKQIDISDLNPGIYILRDKNNVQIKFIKI